jgi:hypothetical protein
VIIDAIIRALVRLVTGADAAHRRKVRDARARAAAAEIAAIEAEHAAWMLDHEARARAGRQRADS